MFAILSVQGEGSARATQTNKKRQTDKPNKPSIERNPMNKNANHEINHLTETIIITKKFYKAASVLNTPEYKELMEMRRQHPTYALELRQIKKAEDKKCYRNLDYDNMKTFIKSYETDATTREERLAQFETVKNLSKVQPSPYAYVKKWFLTNYGDEYNKYNKKDEEAA